MSEPPLPMPLQFRPNASAVDTAFWHGYARRKLDDWRLSEAPVELCAYYRAANSAASRAATVSGASATASTTPTIPPFICVCEPGAFSTSNVGSGTIGDATPPYTVAIPGVLRHFNTVDAFRDLDKSEALQAVAKQIWEAIDSGRALDEPRLLQRFLLIAHADLKRHRFYYWFGFPALALSEPAVIVNKHSAREFLSIGEQHQLVKTVRDHVLTSPRSTYDGVYYVVRDMQTKTITSHGHLSGFGGVAHPNSPLLVFIDPCSDPEHPGWPLRNILALLSRKFSTRVSVLCYRGSGNNFDEDMTRSFVLDLELPGAPLSQISTIPKTVGWERNQQQKLAPRYMDLSASMDPVKLADTAVDLNLKLMRWRVMPELDLEVISQQRCLLLGAGTLGAYVARCLMGWGVRTITLVDNGTVTYSNTVRQPLYNFADVGRSKAATAAANLLRIFPCMNARGVEMTIPMPGHAAGGESDMRQNLELLVQLFKEHDVIYLLTDSRESRWLPAMLGMAMGKIIMNAAMGFDTYVVMRHGTRVNTLSCYFCNDVVSPTDSMRHRTLDQQCTVTRPGLAAMCGALAVELMVSVLQHPQGYNAPADATTEPTAPTTTPLGNVPHQLRGFLSHYAQLTITGHAFDKCTACSPSVIDAYLRDGADFVWRVVHEPSFLDNVTGLDVMKAESERIIEACEWESEEGDGDDDDRFEPMRE